MPVLRGPCAKVGSSEMNWPWKWICLAVVIGLANQPSALASTKDMKAIFGVWGMVDDDPKARGCRRYANRAEGNYFVLKQDGVVTGDSCACILEASHVLDACFDVNLFCRCEDGITVRRRHQKLCPTQKPSRIDVTENGATTSYERCRKRR